MATTLSKSTIDIRAARAGTSFTPSIINALLRADADESETRARISRVLADDPVFEKSDKCIDTKKLDTQELTDSGAGRTYRGSSAWKRACR